MRPAFSSRTNKRATAVLPPDAGRDSETESSAIAGSFHSFHNCRSIPRSNQPAWVIRCFDLWDSPTRLTWVATPGVRCSGLPRRRSFLISAATSHARKLSLAGVWKVVVGRQFDAVCLPLLPRGAPKIGPRSHNQGDRLGDDDWKSTAWRPVQHGRSQRT